MSDILREAKGASKWGNYDVYDLIGDKISSFTHFFDYKEVI